MATVRLNPYLTFKDSARQAMDFYKDVFGGKLTSTSFKEGGMSQSAADANLVMHAMLEADNGITLMASDSPPGMGPQHTVGNNISISLSGDDERKLRGYWDKLSTGGQTTMPLEKAPWGDTFGMCTDKFGIRWLVNISGAQA
jgi:PhnB protein